MLLSLQNYMYVAKAAGKLDADIRLKRISDEYNTNISLEWWTLTSINSSNMVIVFYSERVTRPIFSLLVENG